MTVAKGKKTYTFPNGSSANASDSDVESLHLGSVSSSDAESPVTQPMQRLVALKASKTPCIEELLVLKRCSGRKKQRRYQNRCFLQRLAEEDEDYDDNIVIMEPYDSPFARLLQDDTALNIWNEFVGKTEQEQAEIISKFSKSQKQNTEKKTKNPYSRISNKIKRTIKLRKNLSLESVKESEDELIAFFRATPCGIYSQVPVSYFSRLLLHALAQYHGLKSSSLIQNGTKKIDVLNPSKHEWMPAECFLADFVMELRN